MFPGDSILLATAPLFLVFTLTVIPPIRARPPTSSNDAFQDDLADSFVASRYNTNNNEDELARAHDNWLEAAHAHQPRGEFLENGASQEEGADYEDESAENESWQADPSVLSLYPKLGQVAAVAYNKSDKNLVIFHRGSSVWDENTFSEDGTFRMADAGPIRDDALLFYNTKSGAIVKKAGRNMFYMPHGMSIGQNGDIWVTDVALHQVFRLVQTPKAPYVKPELILGEAFQPGSDDRHFCKPTAVVQAMTDGSVFVADGYCNGRIMKFDGKTGKLLAKFGRTTEESEINAPEPGTFFIPHSLALIEESDLICVADRENRRVQCFAAGLKNNAETGIFVADISHSEFGEIYAIKYATKANVLLALSRDSTAQDNANLSNKVFVIDAATGKPFEAISIPGMVNGHDLDVDEDHGLVMYIGEAGPNQIWRVNRSG